MNLQLSDKEINQLTKQFKDLEWIQISSPTKKKTNKKIKSVKINPIITMIPYESYKKQYKIHYKKKKLINIKSDEPISQPNTHQNTQINTPTSNLLTTPLTTNIWEQRKAQKYTTFRLNIWIPNINTNLNTNVMSIWNMWDDTNYKVVTVNYIK